MQGTNFVPCSKREIHEFCTHKLDHSEFTQVRPRHEGTKGAKTEKKIFSFGQLVLCRVQSVRSSLAWLVQRSPPRNGNLFYACIGLFELWRFTADVQPTNIHCFLIFLSDLSIILQNLDHWKCIFYIYAMLISILF